MRCERHVMREKEKRESEKREKQKKEGKKERKKDKERKSGAVWQPQQECSCRVLSVTATV